MKEKFAALCSLVCFSLGVALIAISSAPALNADGTPVILDCWLCPATHCNGLAPCTGHCGPTIAFCIAACGCSKSPTTSACGCRL